MKKIILLAGAMICLYVFEGCGNSSSASGSTDSTASATDTSKIKGTTASSSAVGNTDKASADFAVEAARGGMTEVALGKIAQQKAISQRVKDFGAMMVADHSKAGDDLKQRATVQNIVLPAAVSDDDQKMIDKLNMKTGKDFDKAYMDMMLDDHKKDIAEFKKAADKCTNTSIKDFASQSLPVLEKHLDSAQAITGKH
jgi:putative membrane protein